MLEELNIFIIGIATGLFGLTSALYLLVFKKNRLRTVLGVILAIYALYIGKDIIYYTDMISGDPLMYRILMSIDNWAVPLYVIYAFEIMMPGRMTFWRNALLLSPFILLTALFIILQEEWLYELLIAFSSIYTSCCMLIVLVMTVRYRKQLVSNRSDITHMDVRWMWLSIALFVPNLVLWTCLSMRLDYALDGLYYIILSVSWGIVSYNTYFYRPLASMERTLDRTMADSTYPFAGRLRTMAEDGYFVRTPGLTLTELASELGTNRTTLSSYINNELRTTFYDYVNGQRVRHACRLMSDVSHKYSNEQIAELSGFNSLSTFRRAFIKINGVSPSQYRSRLQRSR